MHCRLRASPDVRKQNIQLSINAPVHRQAAAHTTPPRAARKAFCPRHYIGSRNCVRMPMFSAARKF